LTTPLHQVVDNLESFQQSQPQFLSRLNYLNKSTHRYRWVHPSGQVLLLANDETPQQHDSTEPLLGHGQQRFRVAAIKAEIHDLP
jgi:heme oxygenase